MVWWNKYRGHFQKLKLWPHSEVLSPKSDFVWSQELNDSFEASKTEILRAVKNGIKMFDTNLPTVLSTDWSKNGIGFCLLQKSVFARVQSLQPAAKKDGG